MHNFKGDKSYDYGEILTESIELFETGKQSAHINIEDIRRRSDETDQIFDNIEIHVDDKEYTMIYDQDCFYIIDKKKNNYDE